MEEKLLEALDKVIAWLEATADFAAEQAPLVAQEVVAYGAAYYICGLIIVALILIVLVVSIYICIKAGKTESISVQADYYGGAVIISIFLLPTLVAAWVNTTGLLMTLYAPRLYILQELTKLLK